jgi:hypothetical protein
MSYPSGGDQTFKPDWDKALSEVGGFVWKPSLRAILEALKKAGKPLSAAEAKVVYPEFTPEMLVGINMGLKFRHAKFFVIFSDGEGGGEYDLFPARP